VFFEQKGNLLKTRPFGICCLLAWLGLVQWPCHAALPVVSSVHVPPDNIVLDSVAAGRYYYTGTASYRLQADEDSVQIHAYLEFVPFERFMIPRPFAKEVNHHRVLGGHARFRRIDSLCTGDVGWVQPGDSLSFVWRYSTTDASNHCRIKVGVGNLVYVNTKTTDYKAGEQTSRFVYRYNNRGLLAKTISDHLPPKVALYNRHGQLLVDDTTSPFVTNAYDSLNRLVFAREANESGVHLNFIYGYKYDSLSRAVEVRGLRWGATPQAPGIPSNVEHISYDSLSRIVNTQKQVSVEVKTCAPVYHFVGELTREYFYSPGSLKPDSLLRIYTETARDKVVSRILNRYSYDRNSQLAQIHTLVYGLDEPGACWGPEDGSESVWTRLHDSLGHEYRIESRHRSFSDSAYTVSSALCRRRDYDTEGNTVVQYDFCDENEVVAWRAGYNEYNHIEVRWVPSDSSETPLNQAIYRWELLNLDTLEEVLHD